MKITYLFTGCTICALAACGGSSTVPVGIGLFEERKAIHDAELIEIDYGNIPRTDPSSLPTSVGDATYTGVVLLGTTVPEIGGLASEAELSVSFIYNEFEGELFDFVDQYENRYTGALKIEDTRLGRTAAGDESLAAELDGSIFSSNGSQYDFNSTLENGGFFNGTDGVIVGYEGGIEDVSDGIYYSFEGGGVLRVE